MRTRFELVLAGAEPRRLRAAGEEALAEILAAEREWNLFDPGSLLSRLNQRAARRPVRVPPTTFALLRECVRIHAASDGAFDPSIAPLMRRFGFHPGPAPAAARVGLEALQLDSARGEVRYLAAGLELDLGGIAKGAALDRAAALLREAGIQSALLHGGTSSVLAVGGAPEGRAWRVAVRGAEGEVLVGVPLRDRALSVSGRGGRIVAAPDGPPLGHILDPRLERPTPTAGLAVVTASTAAAADAWSTALLASPDPLPTAFPTYWKACA